jgi:outer membrane protein assembly factor BamB
MVSANESPLPLVQIDQYTCLAINYIRSMLMKRLQLLAVSAVVAATALCAGAAENGWLEWRGPSQNGASTESGLPEKIEVDGANHLWTYDLSGRGCPVISGDRLYALGYEGDGADLQEVLLCANAETGEKIWERRFSDFISDTIYSRYSIGSPAIDEETGNIYFLTSPGLATCVDRDGNTVWQHSFMEKFGRLTFPNGRTGSPAIDGDLVVFNGILTNWGKQGPARDRFLAFNKKTGKLVWVSTPGVGPKDSSFSMPIFAWDGNTRVFYAGTGCGNVVCVNAKTGVPIWRFQASIGGVNSSVVLHKDKVIAIHGRENIDSTEIGRMFAIKAGQRPKAGEPQLVLGKESELWRNKLGIFTSSPVLVGDRIYQTVHTGDLNCIDANTGKILWHHKLGPDQIHASPVYGDGKLYVPLHGATKESVFNGLFFIVKPGDSGCEVLSSVKLEGACLAAPALWNGKVYVHTTEKLYCFGKKGANAGAPKTAFEDEMKPKVGKAVGLQIVPWEVLLKPGEKQAFEISAIDADGHFVSKVDPSTVKFEKFIPPTAKVKVKMSASVTNGVMTADAENKPSAGAWKATGVDGLTGVIRGRVLPNLPYTEDLESFTPTVDSKTAIGEKFAYPPLPWIGARFKWEVREKDGNKVLAKTLDRVLFQRCTTFIGPELSNYTISADVMTDGNRRIMSTVGLVNQRYIIALKGNWQQLEISSNHDRIKEAVKFKWSANKWYRLKTRVDVADDGSGVVRAKAWEKGTPEPDAWTIEVKHKIAHKQGSPGLFGFSPQSKKSVYVDKNVVEPSK